MSTHLWVPPASYSTGTIFFCQGNAAGRTVDHSHPFGAGVKNQWSYTSTLPICLQGRNREKFCAFLCMHVVHFKPLQIAPPAFDELHRSTDWLCNFIYRTFSKVCWRYTFDKKSNTRPHLSAEPCDLTSGDQRDKCCYSFRLITVSQACGSDHLAMCLQSLRKIPKIPVTANRTANFVRRREYSKPLHAFTVRQSRSNGL